MSGVLMIGITPPAEGRHQAGAALRDREGATTVLVEPHTVTRMGLEHMLERVCPGGTVVAVARPEDVPVDQLGAPLTVLLSSSALRGAVHCLDPLWSRPCTRLLLIAGALGRDKLHVAAALPIDAVLRKEELTVTALSDMLRALGRGMVSVSRNTMRELLSLAADPGGTGSPVRPSLSARELDTLRLMSTGLSNRQIARSMRITEHGVKRHVANILVKLGCHNRTMAVAIGLRLGLVDLDAAAH
jgi:two-component system nitrate/nitrite response regulator NarL